MIGCFAINSDVNRRHYRHSCTKLVLHRNGVIRYSDSVLIEKRKNFENKTKGLINEKKEIC